MKDAIGITRVDEGMSSTAHYVVMFESGIIIETGEIKFMSSDKHFKEICAMLANRFKCEVFIENEGSYSVKNKRTSYKYMTLEEQFPKEQFMAFNNEELLKQIDQITADKRGFNDFFNQ